MTRVWPALCAVGAMAAAAGAQQPVFKSTVDAVRVDVAVTRRGRAIAGLTAADFELRDSGVAQQIAALALEDVPLNLVLAFDTSFSVRGEPLQHLKDAAHAAVAGLRPIDRTALLTFSHVLQRHIPFSSDTVAIDRAIDGLSADGSTTLHDTVSVALGLRPAVDGRTLVLLFTDGFDTASWLGPLAVIQQAQRSDAVVDAVLLAGENAEAPYLRLRDGPALPAQRHRWFLDEPRWFGQEFVPALVDETGGELIVASRSRDLRDAFVKILSAFRARYVLTYSPRDVPASGWHPIEVRVRNAKGDVRARRGYAR